jgi:hypothetical protein
MIISCFLVFYMDVVVVCSFSTGVFVWGSYLPYIGIVCVCLWACDVLFSLFLFLVFGKCCVMFVVIVRHHLLHNMFPPI